MDNQKVQLADRIKEANNVLVTVSASPSVDQLASAIGLTLVLNKMGKHATAVFSGTVPDTLQFLQPEKTIEKTTDSLRDFIIALDKSKADKLRYKVEDQHVKIFITPYHSSISEADLEFSQGDFNVDIVIALGVHEQNDLDQAIMAHGRILHDATVSSITTQGGGELGTINWVDTTASSLCEMVASLSAILKDNILDPQMATALLTGIVAETERFSNEKTTSNVMSVSAKLMSAGANQQLVASKLESQPKPTEIDAFDPVKLNELAQEDKIDEPLPSVNQPAADGSLQIGHEDEPPTPQSEEEKAPEPPETHPDEIHVDEEGTLRPFDEVATEQTAQADQQPAESTNLVLEPPANGGTLTASGQVDEDEPSIDPLSLPTVQQPLLSHNSGPAVTEPEPTSPPQAETMPEPTESDIPAEAEQSTEPAESEQTEEIVDDQTLADIENSIESSHVSPAAVAIEAEATPDVDEARDAVMDAINNSPVESTPEPIEALNAQPMELDLPTEQVPAEEAQKPLASTLPAAQDDPNDLSLPADILNQLNNPADETAGSAAYENQGSGPSAVQDPTAPPPVPPPMMPPLPGMEDLPSPNQNQTSQQPPQSPFNLPPTQ